MSKTKAKPETLTLPVRPGETEVEAISHYSLTPDLQAACTLKRYGIPGLDDVDLDGLSKMLQAQAEAASCGDFTRAEAMLTAQAHTLDAVFNDLARRSANSQYVDGIATYLKLALKAQSQCRSTLEALAEIKAPKAVSFVRQANIAEGHQQVNNGPHPKADKPARTRPKSKSAKQTKQVNHHERQTLDTGGQSKTGQADTAMAAVDTLDGPKNHRR